MNKKKKTLINESVSNSAQMKLLLDTSMGITNYLDPYSKEKIIGTNYNDSSVMTQVTQKILVID